MSDEKQKRTRKANPFTAWRKAKAEADKARRGAARTAKLAEVAAAAAEDAKSAAANLVEAEAAEQAAYKALQEALLGGDVTEEAGE